MKNIHVTLMHFDTSTIMNMKISYMCTCATILRLLRDPIPGLRTLNPLWDYCPPSVLDRRSPLKNPIRRSISDIVTVCLQAPCSITRLGSRGKSIWLTQSSQCHYLSRQLRGIRSIRRHCPITLLSTLYRQLTSTRLRT
jgi:hypothetical protein